MSEVNEGKTERGFSIIEFLDRNGQMCQVQKSSLAEEDAVWVGVRDASPMILAKDAKKLGIKTLEDVGWVQYPIPECVSIKTRMHLSKDDAVLLVQLLQEFINTGELTIKS